MHIKQKAEDFRVEEVTKANCAQGGDFALYRLEKTGWTTHDAIDIIRKRWKLEVRRVSYGGLKDRHAETIQYLTIFHGPQRKLTHPNLQLTYLGLTNEAYTSAHIEANRFDVTIRAMTDAQIDFALHALEEVRTVGVPNYYDDQRFGSVVGGGEFVAKQIVLGEHEAALQNALTAPVTVAGIVLVALIGAFLPVPMAFDVVIAYLAMTHGVPLPYVVTLLCTLGIYSVYSFTVVGKTISWRVAAAVYGAVAVLGVLSGVATRLFS